jgi:hypothetical protein
MENNLSQCESNTRKALEIANGKLPFNVILHKKKPSSIANRKSPFNVSLAQEKL